MKKLRYVVWCEAKKIGIVTDDEALAYELRKNSSNTLGLIPSELQEAWNNFTGDENNATSEFKPS